MAMTLAEIRAKLQSQDTRNSNNSSKTPGDNAIYAHWNAPENTVARVRFLPDGNTTNSFFWAERNMIKLPFAGIKGQSDSKPVTVQVPCIEMYGTGESCPILAEVRTWFKDPNMEDMGRKYWKKRSYLFQGFVHDNPLSDDKPPENPIRRFIISPQIFNLIKTALMDPEMENLPTDYQAGLDFNIKKTAGKGGYADYNTSTWARKESSLSADEATAIEKYGLFNLSDFLPKKPNDVELKVMKEMFEASVDGQPYDEEKWGAYYKPNGFQSNKTTTSTSTTTTATLPSATIDEPVDDEMPVAEATVTAPVAGVKAPSQRAEDILAMIRNRQK